MTPETWFQQLRSALAEETGTARTPAIGDDERDALLELARVSAHGSERWTAPVSTFLVGTVLHDRPGAERAAVLRRLVSMLEPAAPTDAGPGPTPST